MIHTHTQRTYMTYRQILAKTLAIKAKYNLTSNHQLEAVYMVLTGESIYYQSEEAIRCFGRF